MRYTCVPLGGWPLCCSSAAFSLYYALVFLIVGFVAGVLGLVGVAAIAGQIAWILFVIGIVLVVMHLLTGRRIPSVV